MSLLRFLGILDSGKDSSRDTETVRRIAGQLERLEPQKAKYLAAFAYVLARLAHADLEIDASETAEMERIVKGLAHLADAEAALVVQIAQSQARLLGGTENYVVTRQFRELSTREERAELLQCLYAVAAADGTISTNESAEIVAIAEELGFTRAEANSLRSAYRDKLAELRT
ncbi:MAG TPA: TerB family tellurite resistance protein [Myxococcota bacterium]